MKGCRAFRRSRSIWRRSQATTACSVERRWPHEDADQSRVERDAAAVASAGVCRAPRGAERAGRNRRLELRSVPAAAVRDGDQRAGDAQATEAAAGVAVAAGKDAG